MKRCFKLLFVSVLIASFALSSLFAMDYVSGTISANTGDETISEEETSDKTAMEGTSEDAQAEEQQGEEGTSTVDDSTTPEGDADEVVELEPEVYHLDGLEATGNLELDIKFVLPISNITNPNISVVLKDQDGNSQKIDFNGITEMKRMDYTLGDQSGEISIRKMDKEGGVINGVDGEDVRYYAVTVYNLKKGTYSVELSGNAYKTYAIQEIQLDDYAKRISISNEKGLFEVGDVNGDGKVDQTDLNQIISHIDTKKAEDVNAYDLNRDETIDIADIAIIATVLNSTQKAVKVEDTSTMIDGSNMKVEAIIDGDAKNLFQADGLVTVKPAKENVEISAENPAVLTMSMEKAFKMNQIRIDGGLDNQPEEMLVEVTDENGKVSTFNGSLNQPEDIHYFTDKATANTIVIDLGGQIAVKKVTIKITKTATKNLADISEVEFLNNVYEEVPVPVMEIPKNVKVKVGSESAVVTYNDMPNITGFELLVKTLSPDGQVIKNEIYQTNYTTFDLSDLKNYTTYLVQVRAVNGEWRSPYSDEVSFEPQPNRLPPAVDMVVMSPVYEGFNFSWKKMEDTKTYNIYYRKAGTSDYTKVADIAANSYQLRGLEKLTTYEAYVTGVNDLGEGKPSNLAKGTTKDAVMPDVYNYGLINRPNKTEKTDHIKSVTTNSGHISSGEFALVDNDFETYWQANTWDVGGFNPGRSAPIVEFDDFYDIDNVFMVPKEENASFTYVKMYYWDESGAMQSVKASMTKLTSKNGQIYYQVKPEHAVHTNKVQICLANYVASGTIGLRELKFYEYNPLEDDVAALFKDDLHLELVEGVNEAQIAALEKRVNTKETVSDEYHPNRTALLNELDYARQILNDKKIQDVITVDQKISTSRNSHLGFSSLSDLQPLGVSVKAGEQITVYVGTTGGVMPQVVFSQYYAEASVWKQSVTNLKKGANIITVPQIGTMATERGGSVYIRYPSAKERGTLKVRVSGGTKIPFLDIHKIEDEAEAKAAIKTYITELKAYTEKLESMYSDAGETFEASTSVLNTTEIVCKKGSFSIAALSAYNGIAQGLTNIDDQVNRLYNSLVAFDQMATLFYNHKGLSDNPTEAIDKTPSSYINIRAMRMFDGAFMYAGGDHIGIGHGSAAGLVQGRPNTVTNGEVTTTGFFGWGISHEIGHQINQGKIAYAEVTNNIFALLAQTSDDKAAARIEPKYEKIYQKVTSNTIGKSSDVFTTLAMYWQLHLAYDDNATYTDTNSIFAKMNKEMRRTTLSGFSSDESLIVYASLAAGKDLSEHFENWGLVATDKVKDYLAEKNLPKEERKIWYLNDEARRYRLKNGAAMSDNTTVKTEITEADSQSKRFKLSLAVENNSNAEAILGYEIKRNGQVIGFTMENEFVDLIGSMNNRALVYEVTAYDKYLNATATVKLDEVKVAHDGSINKEKFDISSNFMGADDSIDHENPDMDYSALTVNNLIDGDTATFFNGNVRINDKDKTNPNVIINLNTKIDIAGIKYRAVATGGQLLQNTVSKFNVYVSQDGANWTLAKSGTFELNSANSYTQIVYFDKEGTTGGDQLWTYNDISYVKLEAVGNQGISGAEIDVIAPPGDNIEMSNDTIGILKDPYKYLNSKGEEVEIAAGSVVFKGDYRGNPAFNAMLLVDAEDDQIFYEGDNFLFAKLNSNAEVWEIEKGYWFFVVTPEQYESMKGKSIRAELYRVNDAETNEGQRLTSTSMSVTNLPAYDDLPFMEIVDTTKGN